MCGGPGLKVPEVCRQLGVSEQTHYRWWTKYGGMDTPMAKQIQFVDIDHDQYQARSLGNSLPQRCE